MPKDQSVAIVLAGINGAGKTTSSQALLADRLSVMSFVNADTIARGLNAFAVEAVALQAGRVMLQRLAELAEERVDFAFETTLAGRTYLSFLRTLREKGYLVELYYFWLRSPDMAVNRVRIRVQSGGHDIPEATIRQRYGGSLKNFWTAYRHLADSWYVYDNSSSAPNLVAAGCQSNEALVADEEIWKLFQDEVSHA